jgi:hypothetical protein
MSDQTIELNCWVVGDTSQNVIPVKILKSEKVGILKEVIKTKKQPTFQNITADSLVLWKISIPTTDFDAKIRSIRHPDEVDGAEQLLPTYPLSAYFIHAPADDQIHIIVQHSPVSECEWLSGTVFADCLNHHPCSLNSVRWSPSSSGCFLAH